MANHIKGGAYMIKIMGLMMTLASVFLLMFACSGQDPVGLLKKYEVTYNSHNVDNIMALIADDAVFRLDNRALNGKEAIRSLAEYDSVLDVQLEFRNISTEGDSVLFDVREINEWLRLAGIDEYHYRRCVAVFEDGLIKRIEAKTTEETLADIGKVFQEMAEWIPDSLAFEINDLLQSGYSARSAERWKVILQQWQKDRMK